jgi:hypothetical protein
MKYYLFTLIISLGKTYKSPETIIKKYCDIHELILALKIHVFNLPDKYPIDTQ